jgi:hypothetical protein
MQLSEDILNVDNVIYVFDNRLTMVEINDAYRKFAEANLVGSQFLPKFGAGCDLLEVIPAPLQLFYTDLYRRALSGEVIEHDYQCHSPERYRMFRLRLIPLDDGRVIAENSLRVDTALPGALDLDEAAISTAYVGASGLITQCMCCRKVKAASGADRWDWIPLLIASRDRRVSHGLCRVCLELYYPERPGRATPHSSASSDGV